jgi:murein DD-endopeptidase MepM/ murein hydrolase activator NlpD
MEKRSLGERLALGATMMVTAVVTALVVSLFWIVAYSIALGNESRAATVPADPAWVPVAATAPVAAGFAAPAIARPPAPAPLSPLPARVEPMVLSSGLAMPVAGAQPRQLYDSYADPRGQGRSHNAIDIMATAGTPVVSVADGVVEKLFLSASGGITAYVRSADTSLIYYYAHLSAYAAGLHEGQRLRQGDVIGAVGMTGNAQSPHLHFAIHRMRAGDRWHQGQPVNPYPLLAGAGGAR